jgi:hypothetical protein
VETSRGRGKQAGGRKAVKQAAGKGRARAAAAAAAVVSVSEGGVTEEVSGEGVDAGDEAHKGMRRSLGHLRAALHEQVGAWTCVD